MTLTLIIQWHAMRANKIKKYILKNIYGCSVATSRLRLVFLPALLSCSSRFLRALKQNNSVYTLEYSKSLTGILFINNGPYMSLQNSLTEVFSDCQLNYKCCLLMIGINTVAVIKNSEQSFKIFDAHSRDLHGIPHSFGKCTLLTIEGIENLVSCILYI